jgi:hypothetical protein
MPLIIPANTISGGYEVANSLRFDKNSSDTLTRTPSSSGNRRTFTFSCWIKRGAKIGSYEWFFSANNTTKFAFNGNNMNIFHGSSVVTNRVFRDASAWYHIVIAFDTTQSTASNRIKIYVNGVQETSFSEANYPSQNADTDVNHTNIHYIGESGNSGFEEYNDGYKAEVVLIDGQQLDPTSFGEFDSDSEIWKPIDVSGLTFGTNGFYLEFKQSGTSQNSSGLGADTSGNDHHFAVNNLTAVDQSTDTCTNNFATLNFLQTDHSGNTSFSEGNNKFQATTSDWVGTASTQGTNTGKWYAEFKLSTLTTSALIGVATDVYMSDRGVTDFVGFTSGLSNYAYAKYFTGGADANEGKIFQHDQTQNTYGSNTGGSTGDIIGVALDLDNNKLYFSVNGTWENSGDPAGNSNGYTIGAGTYQFGVWGYQSTSEANFGSPPYSISSGNTDGNGYGNFEYAVPSGYYALNTKNLAEFG